MNGLTTREGAPPAAIVIFGASGDLTRRKLVPALHSLACRGLLSPSTHVVGVARSGLSDEAFRRRLFEGVEVYARFRPGGHLCEMWPRFAGRHTYLRGHYDDPETYRRLGERLKALRAGEGTRGNVVFYLATPPVLYPVVVRMLGEAGLARESDGFRRIVVEKPFGRDHASARRLNQEIHAVFEESQVYRIDHYLGKETVQNILTFRFANTIFEAVWNRDCIDHVQITMAEEVGVGHRGGYYDRAGVFRDMFQNHLLQLLTLTAMERPAAADADALRDEKVRVLEALRMEGNGIAGQYVGYRDEPGVDPASRTPTYGALKAFVDRERWHGVPFYLRSGKRLAEKVTEIAIQFKAAAHPLVSSPSTPPTLPNVLCLCLQPDEGVHLHFHLKEPGAEMRARPVSLTFHYADLFGERGLPDAYERLLLDVLQGDSSLFARADEVERAWGVMDPVISHWDGPDAPAPLPYEPGSWGPEAGEAFIARDGRRWLHLCGRHGRMAAETGVTP